MNKSLPSLDQFKPNLDWAKLPIFDRKGWKTVRFGDVVENVNETERDPAGKGIERFIGLEHLEPGSLHIREWGNVADDTTFTRRCRPGQVLFGKRRAYQRKVAVAEFDAVVSGDIYVFAPKGERLLPELLPFICLSERFFQHAVGTSAGSLSPRTNWSSLGKFEFALPPIALQRRIAEILWAVDDNEQLQGETADGLRAVRSASIGEYFERMEKDAEQKPLSTVADICYGITLGGYRATLPMEKPYLRVANVQRDRFDLGEIKTIGCSDDEAARFALKRGDVLVVEGHACVDEIGRAALWQAERCEMLHQNHLIRVRCSPQLSSDYFNIYANSTRGRAYFRSRAKSSSGLNTINSTVVKEFPVPVPAVTLQAELVRVTRQIDGSIAAAVANQQSLRQLLSDLLKAIIL